MHFDYRHNLSNKRHDILDIIIGLPHLLNSGLKECALKDMNSTYLVCVLYKLKDGRFLISSWGGSAIYVLNKDNTFSVLMDSLDAPADLGFDTKRNLVLVPLFKQNKVVFLPL